MLDEEQMNRADVLTGILSGLCDELFTDEKSVVAVMAMSRVLASLLLRTQTNIGEFTDNEERINLCEMLSQSAVDAMLDKIAEIHEADDDEIDPERN